MLQLRIHAGNPERRLCLTPFASTTSTLFKALQARIADTSLDCFLYKIELLDIVHAYCNCGRRRRTVDHLGSGRISMDVHEPQ